MADVFPRDSTGFETDLVPNKLKRLCSYSIAYPDKIELICEALRRRIEGALCKQKYGHVQVGVESFRGLLEIAFSKELSFAVEPHLRRVLLTCFMCPASSVHRAAAPLFLEYTLQSDKCDLAPYVAPLVDLCRRGMSTNDSNAEEQSVGLELLLRVIEVLLSHSGLLEAHCDDIVSVVYHYFSAQRVYFVHEAGPSRSTPRSPTVVSALCLVTLGSVSAPGTLALVVAALIKNLDDAAWEPIGPAVKAMNLLMASASVLNSFRFSLCGLLIAHARAIANCPLGWSGLSSVDRFSALPVETTELNAFGSEAGQRSAAGRAGVILRILCVVESVADFVPSMTSSGGDGGRGSGGLSVFSNSSRDKDLRNIFEIMLFCAVNSSGLVISDDRLPPNSFVGIKYRSSRDSGAARCGREAASALETCLRILAKGFKDESLQHYLVESKISRNDILSEQRSPLAGVLDFARALSNRLEFMLSGGLRGDYDLIAGSVSHSIRMSVMLASNVVLSGYASAWKKRFGHEEAAPLPSGDNTSISQSTYGYFSPAWMGAENPCYESLIDKDDMYLLLSVLESPSFEVFRIAASSATHLIELIFLCRVKYSTTSLGPLSVSLDSSNYGKQSGSLQTLLSCLYDSMYRDLVVFDEPTHSERVATNWLIQV